MTTIHINNAALFRAASIVAANPKTETRDYMAYVQVSPAKGELVATDGNRLIRIRDAFEPVDFPPLLLRPTRAIPAVARALDILLDLNVGRITPYNHAGKPVKGFESIGYTTYSDPARYPDQTIDSIFQRVARGNERQITAIGFNPLLFADIQKALGAAGVALHFHGVDEEISAEFVTDDGFVDGIEFVVMPMRLGLGKGRKAA